MQLWIDPLCIYVQFHFKMPLNIYVYLYLRLYLYLCLSIHPNKFLRILLWTSCNILLFSSLTDDLNEICDMHSSDICMRGMILSSF